MRTSFEVEITWFDLFSDDDEEPHLPGDSIEDPHHRFG
jgi:hypothetical protein